MYKPSGIYAYFFHPIERKLTLTHAVDFVAPIATPTPEFNRSTAHRESTRLASRFFESHAEEFVEEQKVSVQFLHRHTARRDGRSTFDGNFSNTDFRNLVSMQKAIVLRYVAD